MTKGIDLTLEDINGGEKAKVKKNRRKVRKGTSEVDIFSKGKPKEPPVEDKIIKNFDTFNAF